MGNATTRIRFICIIGKDNILTYAISTLYTTDIYENPTEVGLQHLPVSKIQPEYSEVSDNMQLLKTGTAQRLMNITTKTLGRL